MSLLWSDRAEPQARDSLKHAMAEARNRLSTAGLDLLSPGRDVIRLKLSGLDVDEALFARSCADGTAQSVAAALKLLGGNLLDGLSLRDPAFEDWLRQKRQRLRRLGGERQPAAYCGPQKGVRTARWLSRSRKGSCKPTRRAKTRRGS